MKIPAEYLSEVNYEGTRLIEINDETISSLTEELNALQAEANPFLEKMEALTPQMDPLYSRIQEMEDEKKKIREELAPIRALYDIEAAEVEKIDAKATLIKNKMTPIVLDLVKDQLGEFEIALHTVTKDGKLYVEVRDEIEEKIKQIRAKNGRA